ncbi:MAG: hypothetical protein ACJAYX_003841 [Planctomycetota bacterium]|jgi:hypothetical protein
MVGLAFAGATLQQHLEFPQQPRPDQVIKKHQADYVVLQEQGSQAKPVKAGKQ